MKKVTFCLLMSSDVEREAREGRHSCSVEQILTTEAPRRDLLAFKPVLEGKGSLGWKCTRGDLHRRNAYCVCLGLTGIHARVQRRAF